MRGVIVEIESAVDIDYKNSAFAQYLMTENQRHDPSRLTE